MLYTITGGTGKLGAKIISEIINYVKAEELRAAVRNPKKAEWIAELGIDVQKGDYYNVEEMTAAYENTDVLIYIPSISYPSITRIPEFENAIVAAEKAGVKHFIFVGFFADQVTSPFHMAPFFAYANTRLACSSLSHTIVKNAMYTDPLVPYLPELIEGKKLIYPVKHGRISFISREDSARAIVKVALDKELQEKTYILTQSRNYTMIELAKELSSVADSEITFDPVSVDEFARRYDEPQGFGKVLASLYTAGEKGLLSTVTEDYRLIMGEEAESLPSYLKRKVHSTGGEAR